MNRKEKLENIQRNLEEIGKLISDNRQIKGLIQSSKILINDLLKEEKK